MTDPAPHTTDAETAPAVIGWRERVDLPEWGLKRVRAKIDTGARTSAIDVSEIEELDDGRIRFRVVYHHEPERVTKWIYARQLRTSTVRPSHGTPHTRHVCLTPVRIGKIEREIEISLVSRRGMLCRMLLGRRSLDGLLVDPHNKYLLTPRKRPRPEGEAT
ncbi:MAG: RimK/LysX family protein [Phycisphaerales bacterium]